MTRVLLLIKGLGRGGAEQLVANAAAYWNRERFDYQVAYLLPWKNALVATLKSHDVAVHCLGDRGRARWVQRLRSLVRERGYDIVHAHSPVPAIGARLFLSRSRVKLVYTEHNVWKRYHTGTYWGNVTTFPRNDYVFAVSEDVRRSMQYPRVLRRLRMPPVETLYHGLDYAAVSEVADADGVANELSLPRDAPVVGTVANFKTHKAHEYLLDAAHHVRQSVPDVRFVLVGQGPREQDMRRRAHDLGLDEAVVFAGQRDDVAQLIARFDVFALSSVNEGLPISLLEAMALGKACVVTRVGGIPEVVEDGTHALVVAPRNVHALSAAIVRLLRAPDLRQRIGENARARSAQFDIRKAVNRMEHIYGELVVE